MNQRSRQTNLNTFGNQDVSSKYVRKDRQRFTKPSTPVSCIHKSKERSLEKAEINQPLLKGTSVSKQQNTALSENSTPTNIFQYNASDESAVVEVTLKTSNAPKPRSKSTVSDREPWGQLLKNQKSKDGESVFESFDPLRSLHFLSKELQLHVQALLPGERNIQEIIKGMQTALKRVPPEVASTIHLQQSVSLLPGLQTKLSQAFVETGWSNMHPVNTDSKCVQTEDTHYESEEVRKIKKVMEESTIKLEQSCQQLETVCTQLRNEKLYLEAELKSEKANASFFRKRIEDLENLNKDLTHTLYKKDEQIMSLKSNMESLESKMDQVDLNKPEIKSIMGELKQAKLSVEQECAKLKHQLRLCAIEKEKHLAILAVRDRQIYEIRNEMNQLQEAVNNQLVDLHSNAMSAIPSSPSIPTNQLLNKNNDRISSVYSDPESFENLPSKNAELLNQNEMYENELKEKFGDSEATDNIRDMFSELKKQAFALTNFKI